MPGEATRAKQITLQQLAVGPTGGGELHTTHPMQGDGQPVSQRLARSVSHVKTSYVPKQCLE